LQIKAKPLTRAGRFSAHLSDHSISWSNNHQNTNAHNGVTKGKQEIVSNRQRKRAYSINVVQSVARKGKIVRLSGAADEQTNNSDSGTYIAHGPVQRPSVGA
jgi:hypothetical protein